MIERLLAFITESEMARIAREAGKLAAIILAAPSIRVHAVLADGNVTDAVAHAAAAGVTAAGVTAVGVVAADLVTAGLAVTGVTFLGATATVALPAAMIAGVWAWMKS